MGEDRFHVDRLVANLRLALGRAHVHAHAAAGAVVRNDLDGKAMAGEILRAELLVEELRRSVRHHLGREAFMRIVACGHTMAHLPQSMQMSGSQIRISLAIARSS